MVLVAAKSDLRHGNSEDLCPMKKGCNWQRHRYVGLSDYLFIRCIILWFIGAFGFYETSSLHFQGLDEAIDGAISAV